MFKPLFLPGDGLVSAVSCSSRFSIRAADYAVQSTANLTVVSCLSRFSIRAADYVVQSAANLTVVIACLGSVSVLRMRRYLGRS